MAHRTRRTVITALAVALAAIMALLVLVVLRQEALIYFPRPYSALELESPGHRTLEYVTDEGRQRAFLVLPRGTVETLWVVFGGNASLALHWAGFARSFPDPHAAFLLVDYPGYGSCEGHPSPRSIDESAEAAVERALREPELAGRSVRFSAMGHSLGAAAALQLATRREMDHVILLAPFTSMLDMASRTVGSPLARFLRHRFDNRASIRQLLDGHPSTRITLVHGDRDEVIPVEMGRELARMAPRRIHYVEVAGGGHNTVATMNDHHLHRIMTGAPG